MMSSEAIDCYTPSKVFKGLCVNDTSCSVICLTQGFTHGTCKSFKCVCAKKCKPYHGGGGHGGGGHGGDYDYGGGGHGGGGHGGDYDYGGGEHGGDGHGGAGDHEPPVHEGGHNLN